MDAIKLELSTEDNSTKLGERIVALRSQHREEMHTLYDLLAEDYQGEAEDAFYNVDELHCPPEIEVYHGSKY